MLMSVMPSDESNVELISKLEAASDDVLDALDADAATAVEDASKASKPCCTSLTKSELDNDAIRFGRSCSCPCSGSSSRHENSQDRLVPDESTYNPALFFRDCMHTCNVV